LLEQLKLSDAHREALQARGLTGEAIDRAGYRTLSQARRRAYAGVLKKRHGDAVFTVPGFALRKNYLEIVGYDGLLVPIRDPAGRIIALKVRRDEPGEAPRYVFLSSTS
jgi:hypothetical protein